MKLGKVSQAQPLLEKCQLEIITQQSGLGKSGEGDMDGGLVRPKRPIGQCQYEEVSCARLFFALPCLPPFPLTLLPRTRLSRRLPRLLPLSRLP